VNADEAFEILRADVKSVLGRAAHGAVPLVGVEGRDHWYHEEAAKGFGRLQGRKK